jgi:hypothetical protein
MASIQNISDKIDLAFFKKDGNEFEDFIVRFFKINYPELLAVKPQGSKGDGANDGYLSDELLLQVYAPQKLDAKSAIDKIEHDFNRAKSESWNFKEWHFIVNDKFIGIHRDIHHKIDELKADNPTIQIRLKDSQTLKDMIIDLLPKYRLKIYILLNIDKDISEFNSFEEIAQVVEAIANEKGIRSFSDKNFKNFSKENFLPDGIKKLEINLKDEDALKQFGAYLEKSKEVIEEYKEQIGLELFKNVGEQIVKEYKKYNNSFTPEVSLSKTFDTIYHKLNNDRNLETALWVVIAYFFDICDIGAIK